MWSFNLKTEKTSKTITGISFNEVFRKSRKHLREINVNLSDDELRKAIFDQNRPVQKKAEKVTIASSINGAKALLKYAMGKAVSNQEILRRSNVCATCPKVSNVSDCMGCGGSGKITSLINTIRRQKGKEVAIPDKVKRKFCGVCQCSIPLLVVTRFEDFSKDEHIRPDHCWMNPSSHNFTNQ